MSKKHSVTIAGHRTSISLEAKFFSCLHALADRRGISLAELIARVDAERIRDSNLSSALRLAVLDAALRGELTSADLTDESQAG